MSGVGVDQQLSQPSSNYSTPEQKKEEYKRYLQKSGVVDAITKVLVALYENEDRPPNPVNFIKRYFGAPDAQDHNALTAENAALKDENQELKNMVKELSKRNRELKEQLDEFM
mmetsp:Transcript_4263/g.10832  ORF Transcript_4263/g.10832 Transcript_4263/m.10832 type:complete len:113 (-) Transcript_4263:1327-1665(-)